MLETYRDASPAAELTTARLGSLGTIARLLETRSRLKTEQHARQAEPEQQLIINLAQPGSSPLTSVRNEVGALGTLLTLGDEHYLKQADGSFAPAQSFELEGCTCWRARTRQLADGG